MLATVPVPNLVSGVSRQSPTIRFPSQCQEQINCRSSLIDGLTKRPPTRHIAKMSAIDSSSGVKIEDSYVHFIDRDPSERYAVLIRGDVAASSGSMSVVGLNGEEYVVEYEDDDARDYLDVDDPKSGIKMLTVADYTFVLNTSKTVEMDSETTASRNPEALITIVSGNYSSTYSINIDSFTFSHTTSSSDLDKIQTDFIAQQLLAAMQANSTFLASFTAVRSGSVIHVQSNTTDDFSVEVNDGQSNRATALAKDAVEGISLLPRRAPNGFKIKVEGLPNEGIGSYWIEFIGDSDAFTGGYWRESVAPGIQFRLDAETMPHALKRIVDDGVVKFRLDRLDWGERTTGDSTNSPDPSFVGTTINNIFFFQNRLGFLGSPDHVAMSESSKYFNHFRTTVTTLVDSDPIDIAVASDDVNNLVSAVPFAETLVLFSAGSQFLLDSSSGPLSPATVAVRRSTRYDALLSSDPQPTGRSILFAQRHGDSSGLMEYSRDPRTEVFSGIDVTANVRSYIEGPIRRIAVSDSVNMAVVSTDGPRLLTSFGQWASSRPVLFSPNANTTQGIFPTYRWFAVPGATWYRLWVNDSQQDSVVNTWIRADTLDIEDGIVLYTHSGEVAEGSVRWWVQAWNETDGNTLWSESLEFTAGDSASATSLANPESPVEDDETANPNVSEYFDPFTAGIHTGLGADFNAFVPQDGTTATLYVYSYFINGDEKVQSAWSKWTFPGAAKILGFSWVETNLYIAVVRGDGIYLERIQVEDNLADPGVDFVMHLDRRVSRSEMFTQYFPDSNQTFVVLPYREDPSNVVVVNGGRRCVVITANAGSNTTSVLLQGRHDFPSLCAGVSYRMLYEFSEIFPRAEQQAVTHGRFGLTYGRLSHDRTGYMKVLVLPTARDLYQYEFTGYEATTFDRMSRPFPISSGDFRFPIHARNREVRIAVENDTHVPTRLMSAEFEGNFVARSQRT